MPELHNTVDSDWCCEIKTPAPWKEGYDKPRQHVEKQRDHFAKMHLVKAVVFQ